MKRNIVRTILGAVAALCLCASCQKENAEINLWFKSGGEAKEFNPIYIENGETIILDAGDRSIVAKYFTVFDDPNEYDSYWAAWCDWLRVIYYPHKNKLYFSVSENKSKGQRTATVTTTPDKGTVIYRVKQFK